MERQRHPSRYRGWNYFLPLLKSVALGVLVLVSACEPRIADTEVGEALATEHRLKGVSASIYQAALDKGIPESELILTQCIASVFADRGPSYFASPTEDGSPLKLNPSQEMWRSPATYASEVMIYSPRLFRPRKGSAYHVGILFNDERTNLTVVPAWEPLKIRPTVQQP